ncbi:PTPRF [Branchiostoma lanceolatum]|uniref:protein-tyrosine-phosphatase n=1 Tax=Branchiostoma lanceolatum TaxID=7740 RepID=A0A8K0EL98_BRALA|nr:PTPRF [Branchiostoma lanceolatum]
MKSAGQVVLFAVILSFLESVTAEVKNKDHLEPINESAQHGESARWPLSGHNQGSVGTFGDLATEMQKDKKLSEYVSSLRLVGEHLQRLTGKIVALDVHLLNYRRKGQETSEPFKRVLGFINGQSREMDGEDISTSNRMVLLSGYIGIVRTITSRAMKIVHNLNSLGATLRELERTIDDFDEILPPEGLQLSLGGAHELFMTDTYQCPEFHHVETPDIPEMQQENVTLLDFAIVAEHSDRVSRITQEARDIIEEVKYIKNIISYSSTLLHDIDGTVVTERNVALNKEASQSSLLRSEYPAERAVDGNTGTVLYPRQECTHTDLEYEPWWKVDLGDTYVISHVTIINRGDCCGERLRNLMVRVGPFEDIRENTPCGDIYSETPSDGETIDVRCAEPISGRWVSVQLIGREDYLSLCEVQVFSGSEATVDKLTNETSKRWRDDLRCGSEFPAPDAQPGECDPDSCFPCCSQSGYCGNTPEHCDCADCVNYGFTYGVEQSPAWSGLSEEALLSVPWRKDFRCGPGFSAPGAEVAECNPHSCNPCCSGSGWCGNTEDHCGCPDCVDYRSHGVAGLRWREDGRCGPEFPAPGTDPGECDPISLFPCCSAARECGGTAAHCKCEWCIDFRSVGMPIGKNTTTNQIVDDTSVTKSCQEHQFSCSNGKCLPPNWRCDGDQDCSGGEDEESCGQRTCTSDEFECTYDLNCISVSSRCNNVRDCDDGSDEEDCENFPCKSNQLRCGNTTQCISIDWRCDADDDCDDGSDEKNCGGTICQSDEFPCSTSDSCISRHWRCDGELDCRDGSDEENCTKITCGPGQFQCSADKKCIQTAWRCDGDPDCVDGTDEDGCEVTDEPACSEREFQCISGSCIHITWRCDNDQDCPDGSDELNCDGEAAVTCSPDQFQCSSDKQCVHGAWRCDGESDCDDDSDEEGCEGTVENPDCGEAGFRCSSGRCIHAEWRCDKEKDCPDGSDELNCDEVTELPDQTSVNRSQERWREDLRCGPDFPAPGASQGECDPESCFPCCSQYGYCGNTDDHCLCDGCVDYGAVYGVEYRSGWIGLKGDDLLSVKWTEEGRCGPGVSAPGAEVAECNPHSCNPCCSPWGWCGNTEDHCDCYDCVDYRAHGFTGNRWREDGRCGPEFPAPGADPGECDPISLFPCCSAAGECGGTAAHCKCEGCIDFRNGTGTVAVSPSPPVDREYMGCYKDSKKRRLPKGPKISQEMTTDLCIEHCRDEGYNYAGTQYYEECWCGNERHFSRIGRQRKNKQCSTPCRGNDDEKCGGPWRLAVYKVGEKIKKKDESKKEEVNVALNKEASQSSLLRSEYPAERAVDGNTGTVLYPRQECTHTDLEYEPWWKVDLGDTYVISHVTVINRGDCCGERLRNFMVRVGPFEDLLENTPCGDIYTETPSDGETIDVRCSEPISGRWVSVQLIGREDYLSLCEVQIYALAGQVAKRKWRDDWHCGPGYSAEGADPAECDPTSCFPCCSAAGWCGNTEDHCDCPGCTNFQEIYGTPLIVKEETIAAPNRRWRDDFRCGPDFPAPGADPGECDPHSCFPCCSASGHCGNIGVEHCDCPGCVDYRYHNQNGSRWRDDLRCGPDFPAPGAASGECDPVSFTPCCSLSGFCGSTEEHCTCEGCVDFRTGSGVKEVSPTTTVEPLECLTDSEGTSYRGTRQYTKSGLTCQRWDSTFPHENKYLEKYPNRGLYENFCRNPDGRPDAERPWCYTIDADVRWEYCDIPDCEDVDATDCELTLEEQAVGCKASDSAQMCSGHGECVCGQCECWHILPMAMEKYTGQFCECNNLSCDRYMGEICGGHGVCQCGRCVCEEGWTGAACHCSESVDNCLSSNGLICNNHGLCQCGICRCDPYNIYYGPQCDDCATCPVKCETLRECGEFITGGRKDFMEVCRGVKVVKAQDINTDSSKLCRFMSAADREFEFTYEYDTNGGVVIRYNLVPSIVQPPVDTTGVDGGIVSLFCEANVKLPIVWTKGGSKINARARDRYDVVEYQDGRASVLRIDPLRSSRDEDTFTCRLESAEYGTVEEASASINVLAEENLPDGFPTINQDPQLKAVERGRPAILVCSASGNPAPDITWLKDMVPVDMTDTRIKLLSSGSLQINSTIQEDEGRYECVATNNLGTRYSYPANLYIRVRRVPPRFNIIPEDVEVNLGDNINLTCAAIGSPVPFVQWLKDNKDLSDKTAQSGRNILRLENVVESANYTCFASSPLGVIEHTVLVTVKDDLARVDGYTARRGDCPGNDIWAIYTRSTTLEECARMCTRHPRCVTFMFFDNQECYPKSKSCVETAKTNPKSVFYDRIAVRRIPPRLIIIPEAALVNRGDNINLTCEAIGSPVPFVQWQKGNENLSEKSSQKERNILRLENVVKSANYTCAASNPFGSDVNTAQVIVEDDLAMVDGYTARRGDCPGNDIWAIYTRSTTLEECARMCTRHPRCVTFMFFDNQECYPKSKSCDETTKTNPKNVFYDRIVEDGADGSVDSQPAAALQSEPKWLSFPPRALGRYAGRLRSLETESTEAETKSEASGIVRKIFGLPIFRKRRHVAAQQDDSSSDSFLAIGGKTYRFPSQPQERYAVEELATLPYHINRFLEVLVHLRQCTLTDGQEQHGMASTKEQKDN